ncbi:MAG: stage 0 sporulation family protein [Candidatus Izemoplasmatales bacterium]|nr:stage 0 sporulation family protein [bacterium]MDZ4196225.1 stage 0 sporulation family protein [Candidatus Izemoplasmatales bacterium]
MEYNVVPIQFARLGKQYYFDAVHFDVKQGDKVVVETIRGLELGFAMKPPFMIDEKELVSPLKPIIRVATSEDYEAYLSHKAEEPEALKKCANVVRKSNLEMKLLQCEYTLDKQKLIVYFTAEGRIDFRDLVKDLANIFRVRIELRQVGARDGARVLGGIGPCGLLTCCTTFLGEFETVSIRMAKNQNLSLNPTNISGLCGKLLCCIQYEDENYKEYRKTMPKQDSLVSTPDGKGKVVQLNFLNQEVKVQFPGMGSKVYKVSEIQFARAAQEEDLNGSPKELKALEG